MPGRAERWARLRQSQWQPPRPGPPILGLVLVALLSLPWVVAVGHRLGIPAELDA